MNAGLIAPLTAKDLTFTVVNYDFTGLTADELGPLPNLEAALDASLIEASASVADQAVLIATMASDLDDLGNVLNELNTDDFEQVAGQIAGAAATADALLNDFGSLIG